MRKYHKTLISAWMSTQNMTILNAQQAGAGAGITALVSSGEHSPNKMYRTIHTGVDGNG